MKNALVSSVLLTSLAVFPAAAQDAPQAPGTDVISPTVQGTTRPNLGSDGVGVDPSGDAQRTAPTAAPGYPDTNVQDGTVSPVPPAGTVLPADQQAQQPQPQPQIAPPSGYQVYDGTTLSTADLDGETVYGADEQQVSTISALLLDGNGVVTDAILDMGGFLGLGTRSVAVPYSELIVLRSGQGQVRVYLPYTEEQLQGLPEYEPLLEPVN